MGDSACLTETINFDPLRYSTNGARYCTKMVLKSVNCLLEQNLAAGHIHGTTIIYIVYICATFKKNVSYSFSITFFCRNFHVGIIPEKSFTILLCEKIIL